MRFLVMAVAFVLLLAGCSGRPESIPPDPVDGAGKPAGLDVQVEEGGETALRVRVLGPQGLPVPAQVGILGTPQQGSTNQSGEILFSPVGRDAYGLLVRPTHEWYQTVQLNISLREGATTSLTVILPVQEGMLTPPHVHDAWRGGTRIELFSLTHAVDCWGAQGVCVEGNEMADYEYRFPEGSVVPAGTAALHVTVTWEETLGSFRLDMTDLGGTDHQLHFDDPGDSARLRVEPENWDAPHAGVSMWRYAFGFMSPMGLGAWQGPYQITVEAERIDGPLPVDPPHPDLWGNASRIRVADVAHQRSIVEETLASQGLIPQPMLRLDEGMRIYPGAVQLQVLAWVNYTVTVNGIPVDLAAVAGDLRFEFDPRGLDAQWTSPPHAVVGSSQDGHRFAWNIPLAPAWWDPVYAEQSTWAFRVIPHADEPPGVSPSYIDCHITIDIIKSGSPT